ncbi:MAG: hypothetical protein P8M30_13840 [Planctomycetaceae bacterium]|nr:hypothetical protein [Planctomycetaceae bacterium]
MPEQPNTKPKHNSIQHLLLCEGTWTSLSLMVIFREVYGFSMMFESTFLSSYDDMGKRWYLTYEFLALGYFRTILVCTVCCLVVLIVSALNVAVYQNNSIRNLVRGYLLILFLVIGFDILLLTLHGYGYWSYYFSNLY